MICVYSPQKNNRLIYVLDVIFQDVLKVNYEFTSDENIFLKSENPKICYGKKIDPNAVYIPAKNLLFENQILPQKIAIQQGKNFPFFFSIDEKLAIPFDLFSAIFYLITRYEEYEKTNNLDQFGRFRAEESLAYQNNFLDKPLVNYWILWLKKIIEKQFPEITFPEQEFKIQPTFDIDFAYAFLHKNLFQNFKQLAASLARFNAKDFWFRLQVLLKLKPDPYDTYYFIEKNFDSPILFWQMGNYGGKDLNHNPKKPEIQELIQSLSKNFDLGIHPSFLSNSKSKILEDEIQLLEKITNKKISKSRQHFLMLNIPKTYQNLLKNGIKEDYSMIYTNRNGFRASIASPYFFYDLEKEKKTQLKIFPPCVMDANLNFYQKLNPKKAQKEIEKYLQIVKAVNGFFIPIFHNNTFSNYREWEGFSVISYGCRAEPRYQLSVSNNLSNLKPLASRIQTKILDLESKKIWDEKMEKINAPIYAFSFFLDVVSPGWKSLILGDFDYLFPLPEKQKYGISYLVQPLFCQQLGCFSEKKITPAISTLFLDYLYKHYRFVYLQFFYQNPVVLNSNFFVKKRITHHLKLDFTYQELYKNFSQNHKRNLKKAEKYKLKIQEISNKKCLDFIWKNQLKNLPEVKTFHQKRLEKLLAILAEKNKLKNLAVLDKNENLLSVASLIFHQNKIVYFLAANNLESKNSGASFLLVNQIIKQNAETNFTLDFEGSMIPALARFYKGFGSEVIDYQSVKSFRIF